MHKLTRVPNTLYRIQCYRFLHDHTTCAQSVAIDTMQAKGTALLHSPRDYHLIMSGF